MELNIPMNTQGAQSLSDMKQSIVGGGNTVNQNNMSMNQPNMGMQQSMQNGNFNNQQTMMQQPVQQQVPVQQQQRPSGGGVHLRKGSKTALVNSNGQQLTNIQIGLGWDVINQGCDLDASAFMLGANGKVIGDDWFVFYGQTNSPDNSIIHSGDSKGQGSGDDETIDINLLAVNVNVQKITFVVTINEALERGLNFSMVQNAYVRVVDKSNNQEIMRFNLTDYYSNVTAMVVGEVYKHNGAWKFNAVGDGVSKDLRGLCEMYGVNVAD